MTSIGLKYKDARKEHKGLILKGKTPFLSDHDVQDLVCKYPPKVFAKFCKEEDIQMDYIK